MRILLDTNVLFAAFATHGLCEALLSTCLADHVLITSEPILIELQRHLAGKLKLVDEDVKQILTLLRQQSDVVAPAPVAADACRDPNDLVILGTAIAGKADSIVTGDKDLLTLGSYQSVPILTPRECYDRLRSHP